MKPIKNSVAVVITNQASEFLIVKRPEDEPGALAGVWGFPAITLMEGEDEQAAVARIGTAKLGVRLNVGDKIGEKTADRGDYVLHLSDYAAHLNDEDTPSVPQANTSMTQYVDWKYTSDTDALQPAAHKGSLCSQVYLESRGKAW
jgi:8-oxo-dGTP diphosphatase